MEQMEFCFGMFDVDGDGVLSAPELESMMQALQAFRRHQEGNDGSPLTSSPTSRASTARQPRDSSSELVASPVDGCISQTAFYRWASQNPDLKRLISSEVRHIRV